MEGRSLDQPLAATRVARGTDVNFGALTGALLEGIDVRRQHEVVGLERAGSSWQVQARLPGGAKASFEAPFVFLGAGGGALPLLQRSGIPEARQYGAFPVSGQWLVYGKAAVGAPPMSVPHLDTRWIDGQRALLFGPYAGFSTRFLKQGSLWDLAGSVTPFNLLPSLQAGASNFNLVRYLMGQVLQSQEQRLESLRQFLPQACDADWELAVAGQRVQIIKQIAGRGVLQMGTEVVSSADGSLAALLGASPGASTAVQTMVEVLRRCWSERFAGSGWQQQLRALIPSWATDLGADQGQLDALRQRSNAALGLELSSPR
jgi:malate dehydrogenase (quinone)